MYMADVGVAWVWLAVLLPKSHPVTVDFVTVTGSPAVFGWSKDVTPVAALSTARIGVTTP